MENLVSVLRNEEKELIKKIVKARENDNEGTYKNLIRSLADVVALRQREEEACKRIGDSNVNLLASCIKNGELNCLKNELKTSIIADDTACVLSKIGDNIKLSVSDVKEDKISCFSDEIDISNPSYKETFMNSNKKIVMCNWKRGTGKTSTAIDKALKNSEKDKIIILSKSSKEKYKELSDRVYAFYYTNVDHIRGKKCDYMIIDDYMPSSTELEMITPCVDKQIFIMFTNSEMEYIEN